MSAQSDANDMRFKELAIAATSLNDARPNAVMVHVVFSMKTGPDTPYEGNLQTTFLLKSMFYNANSNVPY